MITLGQLSVGRPLTTWFNYSPGVYYYNFDGTYPLIDSVFLVDVPTISGVTSVGAIFSDSTQLIEVSSISALDDAPSFYYDSVNNMVYIRLANYDPPDIHAISGGPVYGFANAYYVDPVTGTEYESRLISSINVTRKKDALFFGKITYSDFEIELSNGDGELWDVQDWDVYGQPVTLLYGDETQAASSFTKLKTGKVKEYRFSGDTLSITVQDSRRVLNKTLPVRTLDTTTYTDADRDKNKTIPVVYGDCRRVPARITNDDESAPSTYDFIVADCGDHSAGIKSIDTVYVDGVETSVSGTPSLTGGTFSLATTDYKIGQAVTVDLKGYVDGSGDLISNPLDILKDIIDVYLELDYSSLYYDTVAWAAATTGQPDCAYAAYESVTIAKIAEAFGASTLAGLFITTDGRFTWLEHDDSTDPLYYVEAEDWMGAPSIEFSSDEALSSATVNYDRNWNTGDFVLSVYNDDYDDFLLKFKTPHDMTFDTVLTDETAADDFADEIGTSYGDVQILIEGVIDLSLVNPEDIEPLLSLQPGENLTVGLENLEFVGGKVHRSIDTISRSKCELLSLTIDPDIEQATLIVRRIEDDPVTPVYIGVPYETSGGVDYVTSSDIGYETNATA